MKSPPPPSRDHCYDGPTPPLGVALFLTGSLHRDTPADVYRRARIVAWEHAVGDTPEAQQDDGLELLAALGLLCETA